MPQVANPYRCRSLPRLPDDVDVVRDSRSERRLLLEKNFCWSAAYALGSRASIRKKRDHWNRVDDPNQAFEARVFHRLHCDFPRLAEAAAAARATDDAVVSIAHTERVVPEGLAGTAHAVTTSWGTAVYVTDDAPPPAGDDDDATDKEQEAP